MYACSDNESESHMEDRKMLKMNERHDFEISLVLCNLQSAIDGFSQIRL